MASVHSCRRQVAESAAQSPAAGVQGIRGSDAVARKLDELAGGIATPATAKRRVSVTSGHGDSAKTR
ncbi:hypothetical protein [Streptomyces sp. ISL-11]|uniref:hypothetical protein n=1 Tax=Streptomyces sp. ISL-11 TaxID=2819174 RepID=UPI002035372C|nr:hypothetical protein [Streptomyces sp. ISL-11]